MGGVPVLDQQIAQRRQRGRAVGEQPVKGRKAHLGIAPQRQQPACIAQGGILARMVGKAALQQAQQPAQLFGALAHVMHGAGRQAAVVQHRKGRPQLFVGDAPQRLLQAWIVWGKPVGHGPLLWINMGARALSGKQPLFRRHGGLNPLG